MFTRMRYSSRGNAEGHTEHARMFWVDWLNRTTKWAVNQVMQDRASNAVRFVGRPNDCDGLGRENRVKRETLGIAEYVRCS